MVRLYLFAEGQTEQAFASAVLAPHLAQRGVFLNHAVLIAHSKSKRRIHRGGIGRYLPMKNDILRFLAQEKGKDVFFTTMIDLYKIHRDFPGLVESESLRGQPQRRAEFLEKAFADDIGDTRFVPYIQLHEYEACLFADPNWFSYFYGHHDKQVANLMSIAQAYSSPELINDGEHTAPSKRIIAEFPDYEDAKVVQGPQIAELIGIDTIRGKCPHFSEWLSRLESLQ